MEGERDILRIAIELDDKCFSGLSLINPEKGNPGIGGTEYMVLVLINELAKCTAEYEIYCYHYNKNELPQNVNAIIINQSEDIPNHAQGIGCEILIHKTEKTKNWYLALAKTELKVITWAHLYFSYEEIRNVTLCQNVKRVIFVGKEQYDAYIDNDIINKATYIYNMINVDEGQKERKTKYENNVTYIGSLVPAKGFHILAKIWPEIIKEVPNANLHVIGTGKVYDRNAELGKYSLAQSDYENKFIQYLIDDNGKIMPSVHFHGILGSEKEEVLKNTAVGIVNPSAITETFCISAIEMELSGIPIVAKKKYGLLDTVKNKQTGLLFFTQKKMQKNIIKLLRDRELNAIYGKNACKFVNDNFGIEKNFLEWKKVILEVELGSNAQYLGVQGNWLNDFKIIKRMIRFLRVELSLKFIPSFMDVKEILRNILRR